MNYWNPYLETLPREELDKIELSYFRNDLLPCKGILRSVPGETERH